MCVCVCVCVCVCELTHLSHGGPAHLKREPDGTAVDYLARLAGVVAVPRQVELEEGAEPVQWCSAMSD